MVIESKDASIKFYLKSWTSTLQWQRFQFLNCIFFLNLFSSNETTSSLFAKTSSDLIGDLAIHKSIKFSIFRGWILALWQHGIIHFINNFAVCGFFDRKSDFSDPPAVKNHLKEKSAPGTIMLLSPFPKCLYIFLQLLRLQAFFRWKTFLTWWTTILNLTWNVTANRYFLHLSVSCYTERQLFFWCSDCFQSKYLVHL